MQLILAGCMVACKKDELMYFIQWLERQHTRQDPIGDLARDWREDEHRQGFFTTNPTNPSLKKLWIYLGVRFACDEARQSLIDAWREWQRLGNTYRQSFQKRPAGWLRLRFEILRRDHYCCQMCGRSAKDNIKLEVDHKVPRAKGGSDHPSNLWTLCFDCNRGKRDHAL